MRSADWQLIFKIGTFMNNKSENTSTYKSSTKSFKAKWILPVSRPPIEDGIIVVQDDQIIKVGPVNSIARDLVEQPTDLGDSVIFPAFVNVHTHLEHHSPSQPPTDFVNYQKAIRAYNSETSDDIKRQNVVKSIEECYQYGTIAVADSSTFGISYNQLVESHLFARVFHELTGFRKLKSSDIIKEHHNIIKSLDTHKKVTNHLAPSSVWAVSPTLFRDIAANERHFSIHLAMTRDELEFTLNGKGKIKNLLLSIDDFDYDWKVPGLSPVKYYFNNHFFSKHNILVHMIHTNASDIDTIRESPAKANICLSPRSNELLSLGTAPARLFLEKGLNICLGTESRISTPDLDMRKELVKCVETHSIPPDTALKFSTLNGAYAIGFHQEVGSLEPGKTSKCLVLRRGLSEAKDPYNLIMESEEKVQWLQQIS